MYIIPIPKGGATFEDARAQVDREEQALRDAAQDLRAKPEDEL